MPARWTRCARPSAQARLPARSTELRYNNESRRKPVKRLSVAAFALRRPGGDRDERPRWPRATRPGRCASSFRSRPAARYDALGRALAQKLLRADGPDEFVVENKPGGNGVVGAPTPSRRRRPDGYYAAVQRVDVRHRTDDDEAGTVLVSSPTSRRSHWWPRRLWPSRSATRFRPPTSRAFWRTPRRIPASCPSRSARPDRRGTCPRNC